jgi:Glycosyl hydrolase family 9/Cellulase N-terminal ig-like domain
LQLRAAHRKLGFMRGVYPVSVWLGLLLGTSALAGSLRLTDDDPLRLPPVGSYQLRVLTPTVLELTLVTTKPPDPAPVGRWNFVQAGGQCRLPSPGEFVVAADGKRLPVKAVGFRRRVLYAALRHYDLRIGNYIYLELGGPVETNQVVEVKNPDQKLWPASVDYRVKAAPLRWSPVLHVNQTGYLPAYPKEAMVGYYLGSLGELRLVKASSLGEHSDAGAAKAPASFEILETGSNREVFHGSLVRRPDSGFPEPWYEHVWEADFSALKTPGEYRLYVPGLGTSFPFVIEDAVAGAFARAYALGIYHQRCGRANALPFTRFVHKPCHTAPAAVPDTSAKFAFVNECLGRMTADYKDNARRAGPRLKNVGACLYAFDRRGLVDVSGGHHDAGDYSKYTINSAAFIHYLVFAADVFPGVKDLDNLGLPESGDGKSDILEEAKWEADFLAKMQDTDGGFYFLVYPRDREYEIDVLPDHGDPQVVFPKTTSVTAAAVAALAQCASSPAFKKEFPKAAARYLEEAKKGWAFLQRAIAKYGVDGSYQKITHYGDTFMARDELAWAACEMFLATGEPACQEKLVEWLHPADPATRLWGWWRLYASYGCAIRDYAFAVKSGRMRPNQLDLRLFDECQDQVAAAGQDQLSRAEASAYGTSFPLETKRILTAGWYFSSDAAFDLAVACQLDYPVMNDPRPRMMKALMSNLNYEEGCNPVNVTYVTGLGWKRQRQIVDQYAENDRRVLPPSGIPLGNIQGGFGWIDRYKQELGALSFPADGQGSQPYPIYDRWGDSFNLSQEFVIVNQARALGYLAWLMAQTPLKNQAWKCAPGTITGLSDSVSARQRLTLALLAPGIDLRSARIVWEAKGHQPSFGQTFAFAPAKPGPQWVEAEAQLPDGRRVFAVSNFSAK